VSSEDDFDRMLRELAGRFARYGMRKHLSSLRTYYRSWRHRVRRAQTPEAPSVEWTEDFVMHWAALFRVHPLEQALQQLPKDARCPCGQQSSATSYIECVFPEGRIQGCTACGGRWLVLDDQLPDSSEAGS
jgi:hypothetical protein